jgi:hypothetical protein
MAKIREVRKRDNRIVPFDASKIADAIYGAVRSVGEGDRPLAEELAAAVTHFLEERFQDKIPGIEDIQDLVETVLIEMGHARVAKAYILYRQKRSVLREVQVRKVAGHEGEGISFDYAAESAPAPEAVLEVDRFHEGVFPWQKSKIVAALIREADLDPGVAEDIAANVERKVLDSGLRRVSTALLRELVDNELFERGFSAKLQKQAPLGLPKYNLEQIIFGTDTKEGYAFPKTPPEVSKMISNRILHQYSLQEVFTPSVADAHREGRIFVHRLSDPIWLSRLSWRLPPPLSGRPGRGGDQLLEAGTTPAAFLDQRDFYRKLWQLSHYFSEEIRLGGVGELLQDPASRSSSAAEKIRSVVERLAQLEPRPCLAIELDLNAESLPWLEALRGLPRTQQGRLHLCLRLQRDLLREPHGDRVLAAVAELYERGDRVAFLPQLEPGAAEAEGPVGREGFGARGGGALAAVGARITINLPQAAFRSARGRGRSIDDELEDALALVVKGSLERRRFIERLGASRENPLWGLIGRSGGPPLLTLDDVVFSVGILGLNECVKYLTGGDLHSGAEAQRLGLEIVRTLERKLRREERSLGIRLVLEETANVGPLRTLERIARQKYPQQMAEIDRSRQAEWGPAFTDGVRLHRRAPVDPLRRIEELAPYVKLVAPSGGIVEDLPELRSSARDLLGSLIEECLPLVTA